MYPILRSFLASLAFASALPGASAQVYPDRPIKLILPFPAGSATDGTARVIAEDLRKGLGQPVIIENQAGADGNIAAMNVKRAAPDGYTLLMSTNSAHAVNKTLYSHLAFDPEKDFEPVAGLISIPLTLLVRKDFPADDMATFVQVAKQRSGSKPLSFGSGNTSGQVAASLMQSAAGIEITLVPYRGTPQALTDLVGGQIDALLGDPYSSMGFVNSGQLKVLAVTGSVRHPLLPKAPTMAEAGYKDMQVVTWAALFAPAKTDPAIIDRLSKEVGKSLSKQETKEAVQKMAMTPMVMNPGELRNFVHSEIDRWGRLVKQAGIPKK
ncbi:Tripartite-type tricarboxylate transporter, receptor component TctC [Variovorax sp. YR266]|uniref:Bug family tripartite tricarboxylate transporter substrate binding protein n=1 Tax=Variovorax sp. YR266 TaxID=1884386 RepID=UPI0008993011|nr:tripartite tricarboxylate transporter substrate binding protein [Variovorax sp. YR266]SDZ70860.1 Tripartite-type tricarboxylate transporter, receptor component TctC [Variovorax sp. YR266]